MNADKEQSTRKQQRRRSPASSKPAVPENADGALASLPPDAVRRLAESVAGARTTAEALKDHLAVVIDVARARLAFVSTFDPVKNVLAVSTVRGRIDGSVVGVEPGKGPIGTAFSTRAIVDDGAGNTAIPLLEGERPAGVLWVSGARTRLVPELWQALASHVVAATQVSQLRDAAVRRTRDLETAVAGLKSLEQARDELLGNVSHELKSPLTTIKAYLAMARKSRLGELSDKQKHAFDVCDRNADRLLRLINDMLLMSRLQGGRMTLAEKPFGLRALAQEAAGLLAAAATSTGVTLNVEKAPEVYVKGDRERMLEVVQHLVEHAVVHNRPGGRVDITVGAGGGVAQLKVTDTGNGIAPEDLPHVFDRFYSGRSALKSGNSGLGLAIVRQIVQLHGGTVAVESELGKGTTFTIDLSLFAGAVSLDARAAEPRDGVILLVEDDADCREVLAQVLESEGLSVTMAPGRDEALRFLASARPALVLLDLRLGGSDGRSVLQHIRGEERLASTPVFVISGATDSAAGFRYDGAERIDGFFEKPLNLPRLLDRVKEVVRPGNQAANAR